MLEWLKTILGEQYTEDIDKKVSTEIGKAFVARPDFNALNEAKKKADEAIKERDIQLEELKKADPADLQKQIQKLQDDNKAAETAYKEQLKQIKVESQLETRLLKEGAVNTKAVKALLDISKITIDGENLVGLDDQLKGLKETEKWAFATPGTPGRTGGRQGTPPGSNDEGTLADEIIATMYGPK